MDWSFRMDSKHDEMEHMMDLSPFSTKSSQRLGG